jgi:LPXTG-motif cell wall-anchored protein
MATAAALTLLAVVIGGVGAPGTAQAASYRYWSFWIGAGDGWTYASVGAGSTRPADGSVQGWRFAISAGANSSTIPPRAAASFDAICGTQEAAEGRKRVALVIDFGTTDDAPDGENPPRGIARVCVEAPMSATGAAVLAQAFAVRSKDGLVCGIDGYPRTECAALVKEPDPKPSATSRPGPSTTDDARRPAARPDSSGGAAAAGSPSDERTGSSAPDATATTGASAPDATSATGASSPATPATAAGSTDAPTLDDPVLVTGSATGDAGSPWGAVLAVVLVAAAGAGVWLMRRRSV